MSQGYVPKYLELIMAVDRKQFIHEIDVGLKANKDYKKFYINIKIDNKVKQKVLDYTNKDWDKRTRKAKAKLDLINFLVNFRYNGDYLKYKKVD